MNNMLFYTPDKILFDLHAECHDLIVIYYFYHLMKIIAKIVYNHFPIFRLNSGLVSESSCSSSKNHTQGDVRSAVNHEDLRQQP